MPVKHSLLTGDDLHEPKGVATAVVNTYYRADGAGSGTWSKLRCLFKGPSADGLTDKPGYTSFPLSGRITNLSAVIEDKLETSGASVSFNVEAPLGNVVATLVFDKDAPAGTTVNQTVDIPFSAGSYLSFNVGSVHTSQTCRANLSLVVEMQ